MLVIKVGYSKASNARHFYITTLSVFRRLLLTADPHWPAIKLSAIIESLSVHVSELKLFQLNSCLQQLMAGSKNAAGTNSFTAASTSTSNSDGQADDFQAFMPHSSSRFVFSSYCKDIWWILWCSICYGFILCYYILYILQPVCAILLL